MIDADFLENTSRAFPITHARSQGNPKGSRDLRSLRVMLPNVTSGQKAPLRRIFRTSGCACAHPREPRNVNVTLGHFRQPWYMYYCTIFCTTTIVRKKRGKRLRMHHMTSGSSTSLHRKCDLSCTHILLPQVDVLTLGRSRMLLYTYKNIWKF